jgi:hypothetical protein
MGLSNDHSELLQGHHLTAEWSGPVSSGQRLTFLTVFVPLHAADALSVQPPPQFAPNLFDGRFRCSFRKKELVTVYR